MVLAHKKNFLALFVVSLGFVSCNVQAVPNNPLPALANSSPVDPVAMVHSLVPKKMAELVTYGAIAATLLPTAVSLFRIYVRGQKDAKIVSPVAVGSTEGVYNARLGYFGVSATVPQDQGAGFFSKLCRTSFNVTGVTPGTVSAALATAYVARLAIGKN